EAVVDGDHALVGDDVAGHAAAHAHRVQPLVVLQPVDHRPPRLIGVEPGQYGLDAVDGVDPEPRPGAVGALAGDPDVGADRALAAALDDPAGGLHQHREVGGEPVGVLFRDALEAVQLGRDLLAVVEDVRDVAHRVGHRGRQLQRDRHPGLHVGGAAAVEPVTLDPAGQVVRDGHRVEVPGDQHPLGAAQPGAGHHGLPRPVDLEV